MHIEKDAEELYSEMITLLLSWQLARYFGKSQAGAIKKTARKIMNRAKDKTMYETFKKIGRSKSDSDVVKVAQRCFDENKRLGTI